MLTCNAFGLLPFTQHSSILPLCEPSRIVRSYTTEVRTHELQPRSAPTILWRATTTPAAVRPTTIPVYTTTAVPTTAIRPATTIWSAPVRLSTRTRLRTVTTERLAHHTALVHLFGSTRRSSLLCRKNRQRYSSTTHARRLWYLDACRLHHDPYRQLHGQQWASISQKLMQSTSLTSLGKVGLYILLPLAFIVVPTSWIESRRSICLIRILFGVPCPGCGMTRAISCVFHGHFKRAFQYNKLIVIVFPLLCHIWLQGVTTEYKKLHHEAQGERGISVRRGGDGVGCPPYPSEPLLNSCL
jgi:hypothetical protein